MDRFELVEWLQAQGQLVKADGDGWVWPAVIIRAGMSHIRVPNSKLPVYVSQEFIAASAAHFEGAPAYVDHQQDGNVRAWAGNWKNVRASGDELLGELHILRSEGWLREKLLAGQEAGAHMPGVSINAVAGLKRARRENADVLELQQPIPDTPRTADVVMFPAAGGKILRLAAGEDPEAALASAKAQYEVSGGNPTGNPSSGERGNEKGATMKETIVTLLAALRTLSLTDSAKAKVAAIEAGLAQEQPKFEELLVQASQIVNEAGQSAAAASNSATQVATLQAQVTTLTQQVQAAQDAQKKADWKLLLASKLTASRLPLPLQNRIRERLIETPLTAEQLDAEIKAERETYAALVPNGTRLSGMTAVSESGMTEYERLQAALDRMMGVTHEWREERDGQMVRMVRGKELDRTIQPFEGIRAAYTAFTGDWEVRGVLSDEYRTKVQAEWNNAGFPNAFNNTIGRLLLQDYNPVDYGVMNLITRSNVPDFKTQERVRLGYLGDIPAVTPETVDYAELAAPTDEKATFSMSQKGAIITITRKAIINDDLGIVAKIVGRIGRSAARTLAQHVTDFFINNAAIYDGDTWFHAANHGNAGTTALAIAEISVVRTAFRNFTEKNSGKKLGLMPHWLMVPTALEATALGINQADYNTDSLADRSTVKWMFGQNNERVIVNHLLADATDWYVAGRMEDAPILEVGFLQGREQPEIFLADGETTSERMFLADKLRYKVRHEYQGVVVEFRNVYKEVVGG